MVKVAADRMAAFTVSRRLDLWWGRGPMTPTTGQAARDAVRAGVGGRSRRCTTPERRGLELARDHRVGAGQRRPGELLDDVAIDVTFEPPPPGTIVRLEATVAEGGEEKGGSAFVAVTPAWLGAWVRETRRRRPRAPRLARLALTLHYAWPAAAARWLADAFGFEAPSALPEGQDRSPTTSTAFRGSSSTRERLALIEPLDSRPWITHS